MSTKSVRISDTVDHYLACDRPTAMMDAHADAAGDITAAFHAYSHDEALGQMVKALAYFRPKLTSDRVGQVPAFLESFTCEKANPARPASASHEKRSPTLE